MPLLSDRTAVVTGGASGIGRATARLLAREGARVFVGDVRPLDENRGPFAELRTEQHACDVRREDDVRRLIDRAVQATGRLNIVVHSAGVGLVRPITDVAEAEWDACLDTNLKGAFFVAKHAIPHLRAAGGGAIVNVSSNAGILPRAHDPVYSISKGGLNALTKALALCHAADKIRVNAVCPGPVGDTGIMDRDIAAAADPAAFIGRMLAACPLAQAHGRMISPEEVAAAVLYLVSDAAAMVSGTLLAIDGGKSLGVPAGR